MNDPRVEMGYHVEPKVVGPFTVQPARRVGDGSDGGSLDQGIIAQLPDGTRVVIGEIWAACPNQHGTKTRIDAAAVAEAICRTLNIFFRDPIGPEDTDG